MKRSLGIQCRNFNVLGLLLLVLFGTVALFGNVAIAQESSPEAQNVYSDAANYQNAKEYALAETEWKSFLAKYAKDPLAGKAQHYLGVCQMLQKKYAPAVESFGKVVADHPKVESIEDAYLNKGWCQFQLGQAGDATAFTASAKTFDEMLAKFPEGKYMDQGLFFQAESNYLLGKKKEAVASYDKLIKNHKESSLRCDTLYALGVTQEELGEYAAAGTVYDLFLEECKESPLVTEVRMRKGETVLQAGNHADAEKIFAEVSAVEGFVSADHAISRQAFCVAQQERFDDAGKLYAKLATDYDKSVYIAEATISAGRCFYRGTDAAAAKTWLQKAADAGNQYSPEAAHWLSRIHLKANEGAPVIALVKKVLPNAAEDKYFVNLKMDEADAMYMDNDQREAAVANYVKIVTEHADSTLAPQALYNAAFGQLELKKYEDGVKLADQFVAANKDHDLTADVKYVAAECNLQLTNYEASATGYADLLASFADHPEAEKWTLRQGLALYLQKKYQETLDSLSEKVGAFTSNDYKAEGQYLVGVSHFYLKKYAEATVALNKSLAANGKWRQADETLLFLARSQKQEDKVDEAIASLTKMLAEFAESKNLDQAHYRLGEYQYAKNEYAKATVSYDKVITTWADSLYAPYCYYGKGWSQLKTGAQDEAATAFTGLITKFAEHKLVSDSYFARAMAYREGGKFAEAKADIAEFLKSEPAQVQKSNALYERGLAEVGLKEFTEAVATFNALLDGDENYPTRDKALYELAWAYRSSDQNDKSVETFTALTAKHADSSYAAESFFHVGESKYQADEFADAAVAYTAAKTKSKRDELTEKSTYKLGWARFRLEKFDDALKEFSAQAGSFPQGDLNSDALFMKAESLFKLEQYPEALIAFDGVSGKKLRSPKMDVLVLLHGGQSAARAKKWDEGLKYLEQIPAKFPDSPFLAEAHYELGWVSQNTDKAEDAIASYELAATKSRGETGARARFMIGELLFAQKKHDDAITQFKRCMYGFGGKTATDAVKNWQAKSGLEAGRCAETQIEGAEGAARAKRIEEAKTYFQFVLQNHSKHELATQAKTRLTNLSKL